MNEQASQNHDHGQCDESHRDKEASPAPSRSRTTKCRALFRLPRDHTPGWQDYWRAFCIFRHKASWLLFYIVITIPNQLSSSNMLGEKPLDKQQFSGYSFHILTDTSINI